MKLAIAIRSGRTGRGGGAGTTAGWADMVARSLDEPRDAWQGRLRYRPRLMAAPEAAAGSVVVLGNGPVGQTAALLLARWGVGVVLLDARPGRDAIGSKAICQQRDVLDVWEAVGAGRRIADEGLTWTTARTFYRDRELFAYTLPGEGGGSCFPPFVNISQARAEQILDE